MLTIHRLVAVIAGRSTSLVALADDAAAAPMIVGAGGEKEEEEGAGVYSDGKPRETTSTDEGLKLFLQL